MRMVRVGWILALGSLLVSCGVEQSTPAPRSLESDVAAVQASNLTRAVAAQTDLLATAEAELDSEVAQAIAVLDEISTPSANRDSLVAQVVAAQERTGPSSAFSTAGMTAALAQTRTSLVAESQTSRSTQTPVVVDECASTYTGPPFYTSVPSDHGDGSNGNLDISQTTALSWATDSRGTPFYLRTDAAEGLERLNSEFTAEFGHSLDLDLTYRDYDTQVEMRAALGTVAAKPGTSRHGTGLAIDVPELPCDYGWQTPERAWLVAHGPQFGWVSPAWAGRNGSNPEYWHYEYVG